MREWHRLYLAKKSKNDPMFRVITNLRIRIWQVLVRNSKSAKTMILLGCTVEFFKEHLEKQFDEKMSWENYGKYWHVDHIKPCASFDLTKPEEQKKCFHWTNLQPLEGRENESKGAKLIEKYLKKIPQPQ